MINMWENTLHPEQRGGYATVSTVMRCHEDKPLERTENYWFYIVHVIGFHGKGFMATVKSSLGGSNANSDVAYGTGPEAYDKAVAWGRKLMRNSEQKIQDFLSEQKLLHFLIDNPGPYKVVAPEERFLTKDEVKKELYDAIQAGKVASKDNDPEIMHVAFAINLLHKAGIFKFASE